jgi:hypothetical protein
MSNKKFYTDVEIKADIIIDSETATTVPYLDASKKLTSSAVTPTELGYISGLTSSAQTQIGDAQADATQALSDASDAQDTADNHIADSADAHAASAITNTPSGNLVATTVQAALNELQSELDSLPDPITYEGTYNATTNTPALVDGTGNIGDLYQVNVAGTQDFGSGNITFAVGDKVVYNGAIYEKWDMTDSVTSVFGRNGVVTSANGDYTASQVTNVPAGTIAATTVQAAINELEGDVVAAAGAASAAQADATQALADAADALAAAGDAQDTADNHISDTTGAHAASAIANTPSGNLSATDVQGALNELQSEIDNFAPGSAGDIQETSFSLANNQAAAANVTGFAFAAGVVRSFEALVSVEIDAASDLYETFKLHGVQRGSDFAMSVEGTGDNSLVVFSITTAGQVQYTSGNYTTFVAGSIKFRAITTTV